MSLPALALPAALAPPTVRGPMRFDCCRGCDVARLVNAVDLCLDCYAPAGGDVSIAALVEGARAWQAGEPLP